MFVHSVFECTNSWKRLEDYIEDRTGRHQLKKFLHVQGELDLFKFRRDAVDFQKQAKSSDDDLQDLAREIAEKYMAPGSEREVNLVAPLYDEVTRSIDSGDFEHAFSVPIEMATQSLRDDWLPKFKESKFYEDLIRLTQTPEENAEVIFGNKWLHISYKGSSWAQKLKNGATAVVGRDETSDIVLKDAKVSRSHCQFQCTDGDQIIVSDLGSSRGTYVNGAKIIKFGLRIGDKVKAGETTLVVSNSKK